MLLEIACCVVIAIKNLLFELLPSNTGADVMTLMMFLIGGVISLAVLPFYWKQVQFTPKITVPMCSFAVANMAVQLLMMNVYSRSTNVAVSSSVLSLNVLFTLLFNSLVKRKLDATPKQVLAMVVIIGGVILAE